MTASASPTRPTKNWCRSRQTPDKRCALKVYVHLRADRKPGSDGDTVADKAAC